MKSIDYELSGRNHNVLSKIIPKPGEFDVFKVRDSEVHSGKLLVRMVRSNSPPRLEIIISSKPKEQELTHGGTQLTHECFMLSVSDKHRKSWLSSYGKYSDVICGDRVRRQEWICSSKNFPTWANEGSLLENCDFDFKRNKDVGMERLGKFLHEVELSRMGRGR